MRITDIHKQGAATTLRRVEPEGEAPRIVALEIDSQGNLVDVWADDAAPLTVESEQARMGARVWNSMRDRHLTDPALVPGSFRKLLAAKKPFFVLVHTHELALLR